MSLFFKSPIDVEISFDGEESRKHVEVPVRQGPNAKTLKDDLPLYEDGESVSGIVTIRVKEGKRMEHLGIKVAVIGCIDMVKTSNSGKTTGTNQTFDDVKKKTVDQFLCLSDDLCPAGDIQYTQNYPFAFKDLSKRYESYRGKNVDVTYFVKVTVMRKSTDITKKKKFWVYLYNDLAVTKDITSSQSEEDNVANSNSKSKSVEKPFRHDIGIENCLHLEFEFSKTQYSLKEVIVGRIYFLLTRLKIKHMELSLMTRETSGLKPSNFLLDTTAIRFELMDGSPVRGETIPIRLFLSGYDLIPDMTSNYFNVKNYLSLVIVDEDNRRYFKQTPIVLYRTR
ncbi:carboxypeptidase Y-deficient protein 8 [Monosporozyma servazzii]